jgi:hypothetical protein
MLGRLEMDVDECISAYSKLMKTVFGEKSSWLPISWTGGTKARFDSAKLKGAIEEVVANHGASATELFNDRASRGCRVYVITKIAAQRQPLMRLASFAPLPMRRRKLPA